jgi:predicted GH43/DUF377 family glycosyl hydrolase
MPHFSRLFLFILAIAAIRCSSSKSMQQLSATEFPPELVQFTEYAKNPVFTGTGNDTWDKQIRERGYILKEKDGYHLWYTGYSSASPTKYLGYATSQDGLSWKRFQPTPLLDSNWVEDIYVVKSGKTYRMFAEGRGDTAHYLISSDRIHWKEMGPLDIRKTNGTTINPGAFGTPTVIKKNNIWYLFYERDDRGVWLATSKDFVTWTNVDDDPVLQMGPENYDQFAVAMNQVIQYKGLYYGFYHGSAFKDWHEWSTNVAVSKDLIHWKKYANNPIMGNNKSSGIVVFDGIRFRLYTMHRQVNVFFSGNDNVKD